MQRVIPRRVWLGSDVSAGLLDSQISRAASRTGPVLIVGESGVGKRLAAERIHAQSSRGGLFVSISCKQPISSLTQFELFGGARGAFAT